MELINTRHQVTKLIKYFKNNLMKCSNIDENYQNLQRTISKSNLPISIYQIIKINKISGKQELRSKAVPNPVQATEYYTLSSTIRSSR